MVTMLDTMNVYDVCAGPKCSTRSVNSANTVTHDVNAIQNVNCVSSNRPSSGERSDARISANVGAVFTAPFDSGSSTIVRITVISCKPGGDGERHAIPVPHEHARERGPDEKADAERRADEPEGARAVRRRGHVGHVRLRHAEPAAAQPFDRARNEHGPQRRSRCEQREAEQAGDLGGDQHPLAPDAIAQAAPER